MNTSARYTRTAIALHWLLALMIFVSFSVGLYMADLPVSPQRLGLSALRLLWRLTHRPPADLPMPHWQQRAAHLTHRLMYVLFFAVPLVGWAYSSAAGFQVVVFGLLPLPDFVPADKALAEAIEPWHGALAWMLMGLVCVHVLAALKHQFIDRDGLLSRMTPT